MGLALLPINTSFIFSASSAIQFANGDADGTISGFDWVHMPLPGRKQARRAPTPSIFLAGIRECLALQRPPQTACASASPPGFPSRSCRCCISVCYTGVLPCESWGRFGGSVFLPSLFFWHGGTRPRGRHRRSGRRRGESCPFNRAEHVAGFS